MSKRWQILSLETVNSTNEWVRNNISRLQNAVVLADCQTEGRGQGEHTWHSEAGKNLLMTVLLKEQSFSAEEGFAISAITALSLVDLLKNYGIKAGIKLPNDIYVDGKKISGLLIEHSIRGKQIMWSIIGVGLNVNQTDFPEFLPNPTSISIISSKTHELKDVLEMFLQIFSERLDNYKKNGDLDSLRLEFDSRCISFEK